MTLLNWTSFHSLTDIGKRITLQGKETLGSMYRGTAIRHQADFPTFIEHLRKADNRTIHTYGVYPEAAPGHALPITTGKKVQEQGHGYARIKEQLKFLPEPTPLLLDYDAPPEWLNITKANPQDIVDALAQVFPLFKDAACIRRGSISSGVHEPDKAPTPPKSFHLYFVADNGSLIPAFGEVLFKRLWLAGYGYIKLSASGAMLPSTIVDRAVFQPQQPDFVGPPLLGPGLVYTEALFEVYEGHILPLAELKPLTMKEEKEFDDIKKERMKAPEIIERAEEVAAKWREAHLSSPRIRKNKKFHSETFEKDLERLTRSLKKHSVYHELPHWFELDFDYKGKVTVQQALLSLEEFDEEPLADPMEGPDYGMGKAKLYANNGKPIIHSFAHGLGMKYLLKPAPPEEEDIEAKINSSTVKNYKETIDLIRQAQPTPVMLTHYLKKLAKKVGVGLKEVKQEYAQEEAEAVEGERSIQDILADEVIADYNGAEHFVFSADRFYVYDFAGGLWVTVPEMMIKNRILSIMEEADRTKISSSMIEGVYGVLKSRLARHLDFGSKGEIINFRNTMLVFENNQWVKKPHHPDFLSLTQLPFEFSESATAPRWMQALGEWFDHLPDKEEIKRALGEGFGLTMMSSSDIQKRFHQAYLLIGVDGDNGKSTITDVLAQLVGEGNYTSFQPAQLSDEKTLAALHGKLANICPDMNMRGQLEDGPLKLITSGESITCRHVYERPFCYNGYATLWIGSNHEPNVTSVSRPIRKRLTWIPFEKIFEGEKMDKNLALKLQKELPGIATWALRMYKEMRERGRATDPPSSLDKKRNWAVNREQIAQFAEDCLEFGDAESDLFIVPKEQIWCAYKVWYRHVEIKAPVSRNNMWSRLKEIAKGLDTESRCERLYGKMRIVRGARISKSAMIEGSLLTNLIPTIKTLHPPRIPSKDESQLSETPLFVDEQRRISQAQ